MAAVFVLFSAGRSRKLTLVPIIQSLAQLEKNYGKEGAEEGEPELTEKQVGKMIHTGNFLEVKSSVFKAFSMGNNGTEEPPARDDEEDDGDDEEDTEERKNTAAGKE